MCGIVGYIGPRQAAPILLEGLARLEYRGYDSAGIALVTTNGDMFVEKRAGKLSNLRTALLDGDGAPSAAVGLAHTRWATHGRPNDLNAHPHSDCSGRITVIHNGIIENFKALRDGLRERGHQLKSDTDTEAIAHLIEEAYDGDIADATRAALRQAHGAYAVAVMHADEPNRLIGARLNVPLIVGVGDGENFLASDVAAVLPHTRRVIFLEETDVADITSSSVTVTGVDGSPRERVVHEIDWTIEAAEKGGYPHFMLKEMHEQPEAIRAAITGRVHDDTIELDELEPIAARLKHVERIEFVACGTANYAIAVTQSGETADTIAPTRYARQQGCPIIAVTNTVGSAITREADAVLFLQAGPEICVLATKTFATQVNTIILLAAAMAKLRGRLPRERERALARELHALPDKAAQALVLGEPAKALARRYVNSRGFMFVGRGLTYPVALEGALKLKEVSYVHAEGYAAGELKHGPISLL